MSCRGVLIPDESEDVVPDAGATLGVQLYHPMGSTTLRTLVPRGWAKRIPTVVRSVEKTSQLLDKSAASTCPFTIKPESWKAKNSHVGRWLGSGMFSNITNTTVKPARCLLMGYQGKGKANNGAAVSPLSLEFLLLQKEKHIFKCYHAESLPLIRWLKMKLRYVKISPFTR